MEQECADCRHSLACLSGSLLRDSHVPAYYCVFCDETFGMSLRHTPDELAEGYQQIYEVRWHVRCEPRIRGVATRKLIQYDRLHSDMRPIPIEDPSGLSRGKMFLHWCPHCFERQAHKLPSFERMQERREQQMQRMMEEARRNTQKFDSIAQAMERKVESIEEGLTGRRLGAGSLKKGLKGAL